MFVCISWTLLNNIDTQKSHVLVFESDLFSVVEDCV